MAPRPKLHPPASRAHALLTAVGLALLVLVVFGGVLDNGFVYDDPHIVERGPQLRTLAPAAHFGSAFWAGTTARFAYWRPMATWSLALDRAVQGAGPSGFHRTNLLLHALNAWLVYWLVRRFAAPAVAVAAAVTFAVHPVQTEAVAWVVARADLLSATFVLLAAGLHVRLPDRPAGRDLGLWALSVVALAAALLSKESAVAFPAVLVGADLASRRRAGDGFGATARRWLVFAPVCLGLLALYLWARVEVTGGWIGRAGAAADEEQVWKHPLLDAAPGTRWLTATTIAARYLGLVLLPWRLSVDYYFDVVPLVRSPLAPLFLFSAAAVVAAVGAGVAAARRWPAALYGVVAGGGTWLVVSHLFFAAPIVMAERALYLPMAGLAGLAGAAAIALAGRLPRGVARGAALVALALCGWRSFDRVAEWSDDRALFAAATRATPRSATAWNNLGAAQRTAGELEPARDSFARAAAIAPRYLRARLNEARACLAVGRAAEAERLLQAAAADFPAQRDMVGLELVQVRERQAEALRAAGDGAAARDLFAAVVDEAGFLAETTDDPQAEAGFLLVAARAAASAGRPDVAEGAFSRALAATVVAGDLVDLRRVILEELARFLGRTRRPREAAETFRLAAETAIELGDARAAVRLHLQAADAFRAAGDPVEAARSVTQAEQAAGGDPALLDSARAGAPS